MRNKIQNLATNTVFYVFFVGPTFVILIPYWVHLFSGDFILSWFSKRRCIENKFANDMKPQNLAKIGKKNPSCNCTVIKKKTDVALYFKVLQW